VNRTARDFAQIFAQEAFVTYDIKADGTDRPDINGCTTLLRELTHRLINEFNAAIAALASAAAQSSHDEVKVALAAAEHRLVSFVQANRCLEMPSQGASIDASAHLRRLCQSISRSKLDYRGIELLFVERPLQLSSERCWRLGMIVAELITNSARHAFEDRGGKIRVELLQSGDVVECRVADDGTVPGAMQPGHGFAIVEALVASLNGTISRRFEPGGSMSDLIFPLRAAPATKPTRSRPTNRNINRTPTLNEGRVRRPPSSISDVS
jgi:two-component sensor histidine kinase